MNRVGDQLGRYRIDSQLGQGGMSVVYKAYDTVLRRDVAIKVLHPHLAQRSEARKRLTREAQAVARLKHPNILEVFDYSGEDADDAYLVTEHVEGLTLRQFVDAHPLPVPELGALVVERIADALGHAHEQGIVHRDLKPENIMVRQDGTLKLMDFGIAKIIEGEERMTTTGALIGSPAHMAPESIEGEVLGPPTDVFSLGTVLYWLLCGELPFAASNTTATLKRILDCAYEDPRVLNRAVSDELAAVLHRCLRRQPSERFVNGRDLQGALSSLLAGMDVHHLPALACTLLAAPESEFPKFKARMLGQWLRLADRYAEQKRFARELSALNQALAIDPQSAQAQKHLAALRQRQARGVALKRLAWGAGLCALAGSAIWAGSAWRASPGQSLPSISSPPRPLAPNPVEAAKAAAVPVIQEQAPSALSAPSPRPLAKRAVSSSAQLASAQVSFQVQIRPFGFLAIDAGPRSPEALAVHSVRLPVGMHNLLVGCDMCLPEGKQVQVDVRPDMERVLAVAAPLRPARLSFRGFPEQALARAGDWQAPAKDTLANPLEWHMPPQGLATLRHEIPYEVTVDGVVVARAVARVPAGESMTVEPAP